VFNVSLPAMDSQEHQLVGHSRQYSFFSVSYVTSQNRLLTLHLVIFTSQMSQLTLFAPLCYSHHLSSLCAAIFVSDLL